MNLGKYPLVGGMVQQLNNIDHISNNLANMNTNSYKSKHATQETFSEVIGNLSKEKIDLNTENNTLESSNYINKSLNMIPRQGRLFDNEEVGSIIQTGNVYDFSISKKNIYFVTESKEGDKQITRDGAFINNNDMLSTTNGNFVLDSKGKRISVSNTNWEKTLGLYDKKENELFSKGNNLYITKNANLNIYNDNNLIQHRSLETSNVNGILEMGSLIENHRLLEQMQRSIQAFQDVDKISNDKIGKS